MPNSNKHIPYRRCIACMESKPQEELVRIAYGKDVPYVDCSGNLPGRGAYICKSKECIDRALKRKSFQRVFKGKYAEDDLTRIIADLGKIIEQ